MISLDQILLLQQKVESAVEKISQLQSEISQLNAENDALRTQCSELSNSLSEKTEQLSHKMELIAKFEKDQKTIESGILKALDRLNVIENTVLNSSAPDASSKKDDVKTETVTVKTTTTTVTTESSDAPVGDASSDTSAKSGEFDIF